MPTRADAAAETRFPPSGKSLANGDQKTVPTVDLASGARIAIGLELVGATPNRMTLAPVFRHREGLELRLCRYLRQQGLAVIARHRRRVLRGSRTDGSSKQNKTGKQKTSHNHPMAVRGSARILGAEAGENEGQHSSKAGGVRSATQAAAPPASVSRKASPQALARSRTRKM